MSEGGEGATRAWLKWGVKGGREGGRQLPVPSAGDAPSPSKAALPPQQSTGHSFFSREAKRRKMGNLLTLILEILNPIWCMGGIHFYFVLKKMQGK